MSGKHSRTLFSKYFLSCLIITITSVVVILALILCTLLNYSETQINMYRTRMEDQINRLVLRVTDNCTDIFVKISSIQSIESFFNSDLTHYGEVELSRAADLIRNALSSSIISENYISSAYIYSTSNNTVMSNKTLEISPDMSKYAWYTEEFKNNAETSDLWNTTIKDTNSPNVYAIIYKKISSSDNGNIFAVITVNLSLIKNNIVQISANSNGHFMLYDYSRDIPIISVDDEDFSYIIKNADNPPDSKIIFNKYSYSASSIPEYNWKCLYKYNNRAALKGAYSTLLLLLPMLIILFSVTSIILSYICAKRLYHPIDSILSVWGNVQNTKNLLQHEENDYDYPEIKYIVQTMLNTINDKQQIETALKDRLKQLNNIKRYALQAQIQPHLIFNTLEIIYLEACNQLGDSNIVSEMVCSLADIIRLSFRDDNEFFTIESELLHAKKYIHIQSIRFEDMFKTEWDIDHELDEFLTPKIILQPIIENSIVHGIIPSERVCTLKIKNYSENGDIIFIVEDDGVGMDHSRLEQINSHISLDELPKKSIGIANVNLRIKMLFGEKYGCTVLSSGADGTKTEIKIPKIIS